MLRPMGVALGVTLVALLLERTLRLLDLVSASNAALAPIVAMIVGLTPHYLGLALPAAFAIGLLTTLGALSRSNELDALESAGWSLRRIGFAFVASGVILAMLSVLLFGYLQPYSRYAYRAAKHAVAAAGWSGRVTQGVFIDVGDGMVISAAEVGPSGRTLSEVFILTENEDGETATTARRGIVVPDTAAGVVRLKLEEGVALGPSGALRFDSLFLEREFALDRNPFRARGETRELTLDELAVAAAGRGGAPPDLEAAAELHARLVRSASLIGIALGCAPLGVVTKRGRSWPRIVAAIAGLTAYHHILLFLESAADEGHVPAAAALWTACAVFTFGALCLYILRPSQGAGLRIPRWLRFGARSSGSMREAAR